MVEDAIDRAYDHEQGYIFSKGSNSRKIAHLSDLYEDISRLNGLSRHSMEHLFERHSALYQKATHQILQRSVEFGRIVVSGSQADSFLTRWHDLDWQIQNTKDLAKRLQYCDEALPMLGEYIRCQMLTFGYVPNKIDCRDMAPKWYLRMGRWDDAVVAVETCMKCEAYYPGDGSLELAQVRTYCGIAKQALEYISNNPGCLQKNIYKILNAEGESKRALMDFLKYSPLLTKEPADSSNSLYVKGASSVGMEETRNNEERNDHGTF